MNFTVNFTRSPAFIRFKKGIAQPEALEYVLNLNQICQTEKTSIIDFPDALTVEVALGIPSHVDSLNVLHKLLEVGFLVKVDNQPSRYRNVLFETSNGGLISRWDNGKLGGRPKTKTTDELKEETNWLTKLTIIINQL